MFFACDFLHRRPEYQETRRHIIVVGFRRDSQMTIKEVCERTGLSQDTVRYYEKAGVIPGVNRSCGGTRCYSEEDLKWLQTAACLRSAGMSVSAISAYVKLCSCGDNLEERLELLRKERDRIEGQKQELEKALSFLNLKIAFYEQPEEDAEPDWEKFCREHCEDCTEEK